MGTFSVSQRRARLARRHLLLPEQRLPGGADAVPRIAEAVVALHSTDPVTVFLSAMVRMQDPSVEAVEKALYDDRTVVRHHAMRRTLWVATPPVARTIHAAATRKLVGPEQRRIAGLLADNGVEDPDAWLAEAEDRIVALLADRGPLTARQIGVALPQVTHKLVMSPGKKYSATVSAHTRVLQNLGFEGRVLRVRPAGTWINGAYAYPAAETWLDGGLGEDQERMACRDLAQRWLHAFGPAPASDLQWWAGWTKTLTARALADASAVEVGLDDGRVALLAADDLEPVPEDDGPWVALLPGLDPTTMGWKAREWYLPHASASTFDTMGNGGPTIWVDGEVVGTWVQAEDGEIRTRFLVDVPAVRRTEVEERAGAVAALLGEIRFSPRFPCPAASGLRDRRDPPV